MGFQALFKFVKCWRAPRTSPWRLFQADGAATANARLPSSRRVRVTECHEQLTADVYQNV